MQAALAEKAHALGFDLCRITHPDAIPDAPERLSQWLAAGFAGDDMNYMETTKERRAAPLTLWPDTRSIILLGMNYAPPGDPLALLADPSAANISVYARHRDYHDVVKGKLKLLAGWLVAQAPGSQVKVFVDTAPVMEKPLAQAAGLGWAGKHTCLVSRDFGSWLFLGSIFTDLALEPDTAESDHCGACQACLDICPTKAFPAPHRLDASRCISYLTIEHKGHIAREFRRAIGNRVYGCDDCLAVCPWNKFAQAAHEEKLRPRADLLAPKIADWLRLDDPAFRLLFSGSPVKRIGFVRFLRNVLIAAGNAQDVDLLPLVERHLDSESPLIRAMAVWAFGQLAPKTRRHEMAAMRQPDDNPYVAAEWDMILDEEAQRL